MTPHFWQGFEKRAASVRIASVLGKAKDIAKNVVEHAVETAKPYWQQEAHAGLKPWQKKMMAQGKTPVGVTQKQMPRKVPAQPLEPLKEKPWPGEGIKNGT